MSDLALTVGTARRCHRDGNIGQAERLYRRVLWADPYNAEVAFLLGIACKEQGKLGESLTHLQKAIALRPNYVEALNARALVFAAKGEINEALEGLREALRHKQDYAEGHYNLGTLLAREKRLDDAIASFRQAIRFNPDYAEALQQLGRLLEQQGKLEESITAFQRFSALRPKDAAAHNALGLLLARVEKKAEASEEFRQAVALEPGHAGYQNNMGVVLSELGRPAESLPFFEAAVRLQPDHAEAHKSLAMTWLHLGDFARGWTEYEWRWKCKDFAARAYPRPAWDGTALHGRRILLHTEQGIGDTFQFIRYASLLAECSALVTVECPQALIPILGTCPGVDKVIATGSPFDDFDCHAALMSLPRLCGTSLENVAASVPYLSADVNLVQRWQRDLGGRRALKVGIVWQGNPKNGSDPRRSVPVKFFAKLAEVPGVELFSLQKGYGTEQLANVVGDFPITDLGGRLDLGAFMVTAAAMCNLDLIVSCDTASAHLAGALARPVWVALSYAAEWRWLNEREDSPWYPTMCLFRQPRLGDWKSVFEKMAETLRQLAAERQRLV